MKSHNVHNMEKYSWVHKLQFIIFSILYGTFIVNYDSLKVLKRDMAHLETSISYFMQVLFKLNITTTFTTSTHTSTEPHNAWKRDCFMEADLHFLLGSLAKIQMSFDRFQKSLRDKLNYKHRWGLYNGGSIAFLVADAQQGTKIIPSMAPCTSAGVPRNQFTALFEFSIKCMPIRSGPHRHWQR